MPVSCATNSGLEDGGATEAGTGTMREPLGRSKNPGKPEYTSNTLIISLNEGYYEEDVYALAAKYDMEILYLYQNFNMCATKLPRDYSDAEFATLIKQLKKEPLVISAERDAIMQLYDSGPGLN
jgi:hypothetical protein